MIFSSLIFLFLFLPVVLSVHFVLRPRYRGIWLLAASLFFYAWGEGGYIFVLLLSCVVNYALALGIQHFDPKGVFRSVPVTRSERDAQNIRIPGLRGKKNTEGLPDGGRAGRISLEASAALLDYRKILFVLGIIFNLALLCFYKYFNFTIEIANSLLAVLPFAPLRLVSAHAPVGISFFTFHALSCLADVYYGRAEPEGNPLRFALYLSFFPKILAGPIFRFQDAAGQLRQRLIMSDDLTTGIERFIIGLGKKVLVANPLAQAADGVFSLAPGDITAGLAWFGILCYTLQLYLDFSGYSDMAIGLGRMFGFRLPENFNYPYISQSIREFWRRWHISLSVWFRDYLYIPMGGNRCSPARQHFNLIVVFLLCGLWHGPNWTFIAWGVWHGVFLVFERTRIGSLLQSAWQPVRHFYALTVVVVGWVFFRSDSIGHGFSYLGSMLGFSGAAPAKYTASTYMNNELAFALVAAVILSVPVFSKMSLVRTGFAQRSLSWAGSVKGMVFQGSYVFFLGMIFLLSSMSLAGGTYNPFIYFKF